MNENPPRLLVPALKPLYDFSSRYPGARRCAAGLILAVHGWGKISRARRRWRRRREAGYEHPVALVYLLILVEFFGGIAIAAGLLPASSPRR